MISAFSLSDALGSVLGSSPFNVSSYCKTPLEENSDRASTELHDIVQITSPISYNSFFEKFLLKNQPCLFSSWITEAWKSCEDWKHANYPNFSFLDKLFGSCVVPVADCGRCEYNCHPKEMWNMSHFLSYWSESVTRSTTSKDQPHKSCFYLKDWHFCKSYPDYKAYDVPIYFSSDWLNESSDASCFDSDDDFRFVYMGPKGSWTPFHADVYRSYSWSANICGTKKWLLYPPGKEDAVRDLNGRLPFDIGDLTAKDINAPRPIEVIQKPGEIVFIPSGWFHQVHNLEDTISINHNWLNGCNLKNVWEFLKLELCDVEKEIDDCRSTMNDVEWYNQCQEPCVGDNCPIPWDPIPMDKSGDVTLKPRNITKSAKQDLSKENLSQLIMKANTGMNFGDFFSLLHTIAVSRLCTLTTACKKTLPTDYVVFDDYSKALAACQATVVRLATSIDRRQQKCGQRTNMPIHDLFDLCSIVPVALSLLEHVTSHSTNETGESCSSNILELLSKICLTISMCCDEGAT